MYRKSNQPDLSPEKFDLPFAEKLSPDNRWVIMAQLIPWSDFESEYAENFSETMGAKRQTVSDGIGSFNYSRKIGNFR